MTDEKLNTGPAENISPEAAEPIATPEQAAASEPQQEQTGPAIPEPGDVVVSFDKINELMAEKRQNARAEVEKAETPETPEAAAPGETPQPANTEEPKKPRRGRPPKAEKAATENQMVPDFIYNIGTTVLNGGISMIIFFFVNKIIFPEGEAAK